jgi:hypothetical protein
MKQDFSADDLATGIGPPSSKFQRYGFYYKNMVLSRNPPRSVSFLRLKTNGGMPFDIEKHSISMASPKKV